MSISDTDSLAPSHTAPAQYPVNLRLTIPFYPRFLFVTLIVGSEKRGRSRLRSERGRYPVSTWGNVLVVTMALGVVAIAALFATLVAAAL
jgi:hypothetical protein